MRADQSLPDTLVQKLTLGLLTRGQSPAEAQRIGVDLATQIVTESAQEQWVPPPSYGDELLAKATGGDPESYRMVSERRAEGVTDDDIRWYWNMDEYERRADAKLEELDRMAFMLEGFDLASRGNKRASNEDLAQAGNAHVRRACPIYGHPGDTRNASGEDRPLFPELKRRVDQYRQRRRSLDLPALARDLERSSSFNALIREDLRAGRL